MLYSLSTWEHPWILNELYYNINLSVQIGTAYCMIYTDIEATRFGLLVGFHQVWYKTLELELQEFKYLRRGFFTQIVINANP
jgi:hypothetical protein